MDKIELLKSRITNTIIKLLREYGGTRDVKRQDYIKACLCTLDTVIEDIKIIEGEEYEALH